MAFGFGGGIAAAVAAISIGGGDASSGAPSLTFGGEGGMTASAPASAPAPSATPSGP